MISSSYRFSQWIKTSEQQKILLLFNIISLMSIGVFVHYYFDVIAWRGDSLQYLNSYLGKLKSEGRWLNYIFFDYLKLLPSHLSGLVQLISIVIFSYAVSFQLCKDKSVSFAFAMLSTSLPMNVNLMLWPQVLFLSYLFLAVTPFLKKHLKKNVFFLLTSIIFFGSMSSLYFLMPLLFLKEIRQLADVKKLFTIYVLPWIVCFIIGYILANFITWLVTSQFIILDDWRQPNPIHDLASLLANVKKTAISFATHIYFFWQQTGWILGCCVIAFGVFHHNNQNRQQCRIIILVIFSCYATTITHGIISNYRTVLPSGLGFLSLFLLLEYYTTKARFVVVVLCSLMVGNYSINSILQINEYNRITTFYASELEKLEIANPMQYKGVKIIADHTKINSNHNMMNKIQRRIGNGHPDVKMISSMGKVNTLWQIVSVFKEHGFRRAKACAAECQKRLNILKRQVETSIKRGDSIFHHVGTYNEWLVLKIDNYLP